MNYNSKGRDSGRAVISCSGNCTSDPCGLLLLTHEKKFAGGLAYPAGRGLLPNQSTRNCNNSPKFLQNLLDWASRVYNLASYVLPQSFLLVLTDLVAGRMHLMYIEDPETGKRIYTLKKVLDGTVTKSAHPARFSPDDKYSRYARRDCFRRAR